MTGVIALPARRDRAVAADAPIVYVSLVFHPDSSASSLMLTDLLKRLSAGLAPVSVLCGFPSKDTPDQVAQLTRVETVGSVSVMRCGIRLDGKRTLAARAIAYGSFLAHAASKLLRAPAQARVIVGTDPPFAPIALWLLSFLGGPEYECLLHDLYPEALIGTGKLSHNGPVAHLWRTMNRRAYRRARRVIVIGRDMAALLAERYGVAPERIAHVPLWAIDELDDGCDVPSRGILPDLGLEDAFVVQYAGNMGLLHDMDALVRAADLLRDDPRIHFLLVGKGMRRAPAEALARHLQLPNVTWLDFVSRAELGATVAGCDVSVVSFRDGLEGVAVPSKLYTILASGRAVVAQVPEASEVALVVREEGCGVVVPPGDAGALAEALASLARDPATVEEMGRRAAAAYREKYTLAHAVERFKAVWNVC